MALSNAAKGKQLEIFLALDARELAIDALAVTQAEDVAAFHVQQKAVIVALVQEFKALGGTSADFPLYIKQYLGITE